MADTNKPIYTAFAVQKTADREGKEQTTWTELGVVWRHADGKGMTVQLRALPIGASIVCREPNEKAPNSAKK